LKEDGKILSTIFSKETATDVETSGFNVDSPKVANPKPAVSVKIKPTNTLRVFYKLFNDDNKMPTLSYSIKKNDNTNDVVICDSCEDDEDKCVKILSDNKACIFESDNLYTLNTTDDDDFTIYKMDIDESKYIKESGDVIEFSKGTKYFIFPTKVNVTEKQLLLTKKDNSLLETTNDASNNEKQSVEYSESNILIGLNFFQLIFF